MEDKIQEMVEELKAQDELLRTIFKLREDIAKECHKLGIHDEVWEALYADGKSHYTF